MKHNAAAGLVLDDVGESLATSSGSLLMIEAIRVAGLGSGLSSALAPWRPTRAHHDPGKVLLDVAIAVALGGDCLADVAAVRAQHLLFGTVASDPTGSRLFAALAADTTTADAAVTALRAARAAARDRVWSRRRPLAGTPGTRDGGQVIVDIDATLVTAHSDKEGAAPTHKKSYGFAPMCAFVDHGEHGTGETLALDLRPGRASPFNSADHIGVLHTALQQLPQAEGGQVLVRTDAGGASKAFLHHVTDAGLHYSVGFPAHGPVQTAIATIPEHVWVAALDNDGTPGEGAQIAELTDWMPAPVKPTRSPATYGPQEWPPGMRVIARRERPHPGAQLRLTDHNGWRITCFATNTRGTGWTLPTLEVRHRQRPLRRPHPLPQRHRPAQPAVPPLPDQPDLARGDRPGRRPHRLDPNPGLRRPSTRTPVGTQTLPLPPTGRGRPTHPHRPQTQTPTTPRLALDPPDPHRLDPSARSINSNTHTSSTKDPDNRRAQHRR